jgi:DUF4097 and DUF4098 domain-containing protein YvlB
MTKLERTFTIQGSPELEVSIAAGSVTVGESAGDSVMVSVSGSEAVLDTVEIEQLGRTVVVRQQTSGRRLFAFARSIDVVVEMPAGGDAAIKTAAGDVRTSLVLTDLQVKVASGDVRVARVTGTCVVKSASGSVVVDHAGEAQLGSASGDIRVERVDSDLTASTASGDIAIGSFGKSATLKTASGDIVVDRLDGAELDVKSMSGNVRVGLPPGLQVEAKLQSLSGSIRNELDEPSGERGRHAYLRAKTVSGDIVLRSAPAVAD